MVIEAKHQPLVGQSRHRSRITYLDKHPELGTRRFVPGELGDLILPNCYGTLIYVLGLNKLFHRWANNGEMVVFPQLVESGPAFIQTGVMGKFLDEFCEPCDPVQDCIVSSDSSNPEIGHPYHTGLYLGRIEQDYIMFHQYGRGGIFEISTLRTHKRKVFEYERKNKRRNPRLEYRFLSTQRLLECSRLL
jgi:hypothetical protein